MEKARKRSHKPKLTSQDNKMDPEMMKKKLAERIEMAASNRRKEIEKLHAKLAIHEERAKRVQERKRRMNASKEELRLSVGGENGLDSARESTESKDSVQEKAISSLEAASNSRTGSGRSLLSDATVSDDSQNSNANPLKTASQVDSTGSLPQSIY
jgi:hypothetical protein